MGFVSGFLVLTGLIACLPFLAEWRRQPMGHARQATAPGEIADLPSGATHYRWAGRETDPVVVCIHGLSTPSFVFAATERSLVALGYRVLSYDLYGRGYSARARGAQDLVFFMEQLDALLADQGVADAFTLLGFSMGGQIATAFAARDDRVERLVLVAPAGLADTAGMAPGWVWSAPIIGDWTMRVFGGIWLRRELVEHTSIATVIPDFEDRQAAETGMRGYLPALLSSRRHVLDHPNIEDYRQVARRRQPVMAIWGAADPVIPRRAMSGLARLNPDAQHVEIKGAGHNLLQTHPSEVAAALKAFLVA
ncbi:MAG: alpha/beta hydrolase [Pseudomonadota bacterium]